MKFKFLKKPLLKSFFILLFIFATNKSWARTVATNDDKYNCSGSQCVADGKAYLFVLGIIGATVLPIWLVSERSSDPYLDKLSGFVEAGGFIEQSKYFSFGFEKREVPNIPFDLSASSTLANAASGEINKIRYRLVSAWPLFKDGDNRISIGAGIGLEYHLENKSLLSSTGPEVSWLRRWRSAYSSSIRASYWQFPKSVYRIHLDVNYIPVLKTSILPNSILGYELERDENIKGTTQYLLFGFLF